MKMIIIAVVYIVIGITIAIFGWCCGDNEIREKYKENLLLVDAIAFTSIVILWPYAIYYAIREMTRKHHTNGES